MNEFDPVKVDRISPDDARSIRDGGTLACLRGVEFFNFGAFFSRAYRENDYLWGRLHGAERMIDLLGSTLDEPLDALEVRKFKRDAFLAILDEEQDRLLAEPGMVDKVRSEVVAAFAECDRPGAGADPVAGTNGAPHEATEPAASGPSAEPASLEQGAGSA